MHPATKALLSHFAYDHLREQLQAVSRPFSELAHDLAERLDGPELTVGLRKLLEAKDCCVRAARMDGTHSFDTSAAENHYDAIKRLTSEVGWDISLDEAAVARLRATTRGQVTRADFVRGLLREAGAEGYTLVAPPGTPPLDDDTPSA